MAKCYAYRNDGLLYFFCILYYAFLQPLKSFDADFSRNIQPTLEISQKFLNSPQLKMQIHSTFFKEEYTNRTELVVSFSRNG